MRVSREPVSREPVDAPPARRARERTADGSADVLRLQRAAGNRAVTRLLARAPKTEERAPAVPWRGEVTASWNAALRRRPSKDPANPYEGIVADLERGTEVIVVGQERGWLRAEVTVGGKKLAGYISRELVRHVGPVVQAPPPIDLSQPLDLGVLVPSAAFVALKRAANRRIAIPDWEPTKEERRELDLAADTLENSGRYLVDRSTFAVSFASSSYGKLTVTTIEDFILFVEAVENEYPQATPGEVAGEIRQIQFAGGNWETLLNSPGISDGGRPVDIENPANPIAKRFDIAALKANHKLTTAYGDVDVLHVVAGIDAALNGSPKSAASVEEEDQLKFKTMTAAHGGDPRDFATWSGDLGQAYADYLSARHVEGKKDAKLLRHLESAAPPAELLGDIHGYIALNVFNRTPPPVRTGWFMTGQDATVSNVLRTLYLVRKHGTAGAATYQSLLEEASGKSGGDLKAFVTARAVAFARIWYVKNAKSARGDFGSAKHAGSLDKSVILEGLLKEFDALHADNERNAAPEDQLGTVIGRFLPMLGGSLD
jgi:hypothetical protein